MTQPSGFLLVDKPTTWTSFDVCAKLRGLLSSPGAKRKDKVKIGHTGTLDPFATGLLFVAVGRATKLIPYFEKDRKIYETEIILGKTSETLDGTSQIIKVQPTLDNIQQNNIQQILDVQFTGKIEQVPPKYSALKVEGKRAYDLARQGSPVELKSRSTEVFEIKILEYEYPKLKLHLDVAAGFYVRALARDLGKALGSGGYCDSLRRVGIGQYSIDHIQYSILTEKELQDSKFSIRASLLDPQALLPHIPILEIEPGRFNDFKEGRAFPVVAHDKPETLVTIDGSTVGLGEVIHGKLQPRILLV